MRGARILVVLLLFVGYSEWATAFVPRHDTLLMMRRTTMRAVEASPQKSGGADELTALARPRPAANDETKGKKSPAVKKRAVMPITRGVAGGASGEDGVISFTVFGEPIPLHRHMLSQGRMYNPSATQQRNFARACAMQLPETPLQGPIEAKLTFYFSRPLNHYRTGKFAGQLKPGMPTWHSKRKDIDNLIKFVFDSLNGLAYEDDSQISAVSSAKMYTNGEPRTEVFLRTLKDEPKEPSLPSTTTPVPAAKR